MTDNSSDDTGQDLSSDVSTDIETNAIQSNYKVLGQLAADNGVGVLGQNDASSGTPIGVQGAVPNNSAGYGLATSDDLRLEGVLDTDETDFVVEAGTTSTEEARNVVL